MSLAAGCLRSWRCVILPKPEIDRHRPPAQAPRFRFRPEMSDGKRVPPRHRDHRLATGHPNSSCIRGRQAMRFSRDYSEFFDMSTADPRIVKQMRDDLDKALRVLLDRLGLPFDS